MTIVLALQVLLPLALIAWLWLSPPRNRLVLVLHTAALGLLIAALILTGLWTVLPWWLPWLYAAMAVIALLRGWRDVRQATMPNGIAGWLRAALLMGITLFCGSYVLEGIAGRKLPAGPTVELAWPLPAGDYMIANGGANLSVSSHAETLDLAVPRRRIWHGQSYGVDIVALNAAGRSVGGWLPSDADAYAVQGRPVLAPCPGKVLAARDGLSDNRVPEMPALPDPGNYVLLRCGEYDVLLAHFRRGSLAASAGQTVKVGQKMGEAGNSGSSSEPHLHIHAQTHGSAAHPLSGKPVPILFNGRWPIRGQRF
jgi:hypothetical protein